MTIDSLLSVMLSAGIIKTAIKLTTSKESRYGKKLPIRTIKMNEVESLKFQLGEVEQASKEGAELFELEIHLLKQEVDRYRALLTQTMHQNSNLQKQISIYMDLLCPIFYDPMREAWVDEFDPNFEVGMTPEGGEPKYSFKTQVEFWEWYRGDYDA
jgi:hypothetical protein